MKVHEKTWLAVAERQHGLISCRQLIAAGLSARHIDLRVSAGLLVRQHRGVYRLAGAPASFEQATLAACLASNGVASHRAAAALWALRGCEPAQVEIAVAGRRRPELVGVLAHTTDFLPPVDVSERSRVPVTTPARTLLDLAAVVPGAVVEGALEDALHRQLVTIRWLEQSVTRPSSRTRPGAGVVRDLLGGRAPGQGATESPLEDELVRLLREAGLPEPVRQHRVTQAPSRSVRIDISYPDRLVAIEAQGLLWHAGRADLQRDCEKRNVLVRLGWRILVFTWHDVRHRPAAVVDAVRAALADELPTNAA